MWSRYPSLLMIISAVAFIVPSLGHCISSTVAVCRGYVSYTVCMWWLRQLYGTYVVITSALQSVCHGYVRSTLCHSYINSTVCHSYISSTVRVISALQSTTVISALQSFTIISALQSVTVISALQYFTVISALHSITVISALQSCYGY